MKYNFYLKTLLLMALFCQGALMLKAQDVRYTLDTLRNKKWSYQAIIHAGAYVDAEGNKFSPTSGGAFVYARYHLLKRITLAGSAGFLPVKVGNADLSKAYFGEGRVSLNFKKEVATSMENFKLGSDGAYKYSASAPIASGQLYGLTGSMSVQNRLHTEAKDSNYVWKVKELATNKDTAMGNVSTQTTVSMISAGFFYSKSMNFKGRFKMSNGWTKIRRKRNSMDVAFEMLFAPTISVDKTPTLINQKGDASLVNRFEIYDVRYKRMGWRVQVHMHRGIISTFFELGGRPGVYFNMNDVKPEDNKWYAKIYDGFYMRFGMGIGIGFINLN